MSLRGAEGGGGVLVGHVKCSAPEVFVPSMPGQNYALAIDAIQAVVGHRCPDGDEADLPDDPAAWVTP